MGVPLWTASGFTWGFRRFRGGMVQAVGLPGSVARGKAHGTGVATPGWACMCARSRRATHVHQGTERPRREINPTNPRWYPALFRRVKSYPAGIKNTILQHRTTLRFAAARCMFHRNRHLRRDHHPTHHPTGDCIPGYQALTPDGVLGSAVDSALVNLGGSAAGCALVHGGGSAASGGGMVQAVGLPGSVARGKAHGTGAATPGNGRTCARGRGARHTCARARNGPAAKYRCRRMAE